MKTITFLRVQILVLLVLLPDLLSAQEEAKFEIIPSADIVSNYIWRGGRDGGASVQPGLTLSYAGLSFTAWGSTDFSTVAKEIDFTLSYEYKGLTLAVTDYWWGDDDGEMKFGHYTSQHFMEGTIGYYFGENLPLSIAWNTMFGFDGDKDEKGDRNYSTYIEAYYDFNVLGVDVIAGIGVSPWTGIYHKPGTDGFVLSSLSLRATKGIRFTDSFTLPVFTELIFAPNRDNVFIVFGLTL